MGIDFLVCPRCSKGFPDCNDYTSCFICDNLCACKYSQCKKKATFIYNKKKYYLCEECYPNEYKIVKQKILNKNYERDLKFIQSEIDEINNENDSD